MTREEAIDMLHGMRADNLNLDDLYIKAKYEALGMAIEALEQEPKTEHWIPISSTDMYCSRCHELEHLDTSRKFCAHCGARMVEPQERSGKE